jgi:DNA replication protein DnaC
MTVYDAVRHIKSTWGSNSKLSELQAVANLVEPDLLILDEVGQQYGSEAERQILFDVLNKRYEARRPCILLSNLDMKDVIAFLGERVVDRLAEDGAAFVAFKWESHRRGKK